MSQTLVREAVAAARAPARPGRLRRRALLVCLLCVGAAILVGTLIFTWRGNYTASRHQTVTNAAFFWTFVVVSWLAIFATIHLSPYGF